MTTPKTFVVSITGEHVLTADDIWPDGDAPENPTVEDVIAVMRKCASRPARLAEDWGLGFDVEVDGKVVFS